MIVWLRILQGIGITTLSKEEIGEYERLRSKQTIQKHAHSPKDKSDLVHSRAAKALEQLKAESESVKRKA